MLDGLLGRGGFSSKCKSLIKPTRTRIEVLRRRAEAKQRFLKEDLVKLLANGLDVNAYGRVVIQTEDFIAGLNLLSCYSFIDQSCEYILKQLSVMQKLGQCPEECRETVASLMFAAARFSDLPELRDLRDVFQERYGTGLECYVNRVFVEKIASNPPVVEKRIKLLQDIAAEFSIHWDSIGFKQRMDKPSKIAEDQARKIEPLSVADDKYKLPNGNNVLQKNDQLSKERTEHAHEGSLLHNGGNVNVRRKEVLAIPFVGREEKNVYKHEDGGHFSKAKHDSASEKNGFGKNDRVNTGGKERLGYKQEPVTIRAETIDSRDNHDQFFRGRQEFTVKKHGSSSKPDNTPVVKSPRTFRDRKPEILGTGSEAAFLKGEMPNHLYHRKSEGNTVNGDGEDAMKSTGKVQEEETIRLKPCYNGSLPPPYVKSNIPPPYSKPKGHGSKNTTLDSIDAIMGSKTDWIHRTQDGPFHEHRARRSSDDLSPRNVSNSDTSKKERDHDGIWEDRRYQNDIPLPKPRSIRRKHYKSSSSHDDMGSSEDARIVKRISSSRRKERKGLQILFDDEHYHRDDEENMMDKLLLHYSKKPSAYDVGKLRRKKSSRSNTSKSPNHRSKDEAEMIVPPTRSISLPHEQSGESQHKKVYARANSFQADNQAPHVHPKLPDYDDLAARFAALRGR